MKPNSGALLIDKPKDWTSFDVIRSLKKAFYESGSTKKTLPKFGHCGTLDPFATGLLVVLVNDGLRFAKYFLNSEKSYRGQILFGKTTASLDLTTPYSDQTGTVPDSLECIQKEARWFCEGNYFQIPPMYSAKKVDGKRMYELARKGQTIEQAAILKKIHEFEIQEYAEARSQFSVTCESGTYVRTLAADLAARLRTVAVLEELRRTRSGQFNLSNALPLQEVLDGVPTGIDHLKCFIPLNDLVSNFDRLEVPSAVKSRIQNGVQSDIPNLIQEAKLTHAKELKSTLVLTHENELVAMLKTDEPNQWKIDWVIVSTLG